jgi:hypothetical protein
MGYTVTGTREMSAWTAILMRGHRRSEVVVEGDLSSDADLVRGDPAFEEVRQFLDVLQVHEL